MVTWIYLQFDIVPCFLSVQGKMTFRSLAVCAFMSRWFRNHTTVCWHWQLITRYSWTGGWDGCLLFCFVQQRLYMEVKRISALELSGVWHWCCWWCWATTPSARMRARARKRLSLSLSRSLSLSLPPYLSSSSLPSSSLSSTRTKRSVMASSNHVTPTNCSWWPISALDEDGKITDGEDCEEPSSEPKPFSKDRLVLYHWTQSFTSQKVIKTHTHRA